MTLGRLTARKHLNVLGLNSGTSADGLDLAVLRIGDNLSSVRVIAGSTRRFPAKLRELILQAADHSEIHLESLLRLDNYLGKFIGESAALYMKSLAEQGVRVDLVGSHGQTVRHVPQKVRVGRFLVRGTCQLGSLDQIAAVTGCVTVGDFRQADIAAGGEGAPITTGAMIRLFGNPKESRLIVNIGGMANYFYIPKGSLRLVPAARDCGPGNSLSDILTSRLFHRAYDRNGRLATRGTAHRELLSRLLAKPFFSSSARSTGREAFGSALAEEMLQFGRMEKLAPEDLIATAAELTVTAIAAAVRPIVAQDLSLTRVYLIGGGRRNSSFRSRLAGCLPELEIRLIDELGFDGDLIEAACYGVMAAACLWSRPLPSALLESKSARLRAILGRIAQPPLVQTH